MLKKLSFLKSKRQDQDLPTPDLGRIFPDFRKPAEVTESATSQDDSLAEATGDALAAAALPRPPRPGTFSSLFDESTGPADASGFEDFDAAARAHTLDLDAGTWGEAAAGWPGAGSADGEPGAPLEDAETDLTPDPVPTAADLDDLDDLFEPEDQGGDDGADATHRDDWIKADLDTLERQWREASDAPHDPSRQRRLFLAAHNLRGQADPAEQPLLSRLAASLCELLTLSGALTRADALVGLHVAACRAAMAEGAGDDARSEAVCTALEDAVSAYRTRAEAA